MNYFIPNIKINRKKLNETFVKFIFQIRRKWICLTKGERGEMGKGEKKIYRLTNT